jgi:hypothetical protein
MIERGLGHPCRLQLNVCNCQGIYIKIAEVHAHHRVQLHETVYFPRVSLISATEVRVHRCICDIKDTPG